MQRGTCISLYIVVTLPNWICVPHCYILIGEMIIFQKNVDRVTVELHMIEVGNCFITSSPLLQLGVVKISG